MRCVLLFFVTGSMARGRKWQLFLGVGVKRGMIRYKIVIFSDQGVVSVD